METAETALKDATAANVQLSEKILTQVGEYIVQDKAEDVARELAHYFKGKKTYDYAQIRRNPNLRKVAIQKIYAWGKEAGYTDLYDQHGYILFHPDPQVEGRNQLDWQKEYPETTEMVKRSFTENNVSGYFTFFDQNKRERQKYSVRVHIPGTPFIVAAIVNIDEFFQPTLEKIKSASEEISARTRGAPHRAGKGRRSAGQVRQHDRRAGLVFYRRLWGASISPRPFPGPCGVWTRP